MQDKPYIKLLADVRSRIETGDHDGAKSVCSEYCETHPDKADSWLLFGWVCSEINAYDEAMRCFQSAVRLQPGSVDAYLNIGIIYQHWNDLPAALTCYSRALRLQPDSVVAQYNIGLIQERQGEFVAALESFRNAHLLNPALNDPVLAQAAVYEKIGKPDDALSILMPLIDSGLKSVKAGVTFSRTCRDKEQYQQAIEYLQSISENNLDKKDLIDFHFTLGRLYDHISKYDVAFRHYRTGNIIHGSNYDGATDARYLGALPWAYNLKSIQSAPAPNIQSNKPIFIVGMPRSGTSLVEKILASHPDVVDGGELPDIMRIARELNLRFGIKSDVPVPVSKLTSELVDRYASDYLSVLKRISDMALHVTDKMPHNFLYLGLINTLFPNAKIIHCMRHPLDTCLSCYFQHFAGSTMPCSYDLINMGRYYNHY